MPSIRLAASLTLLAISIAACSSGKRPEVLATAAPERSAPIMSSAAPPSSASARPAATAAAPTPTAEPLPEWDGKWPAAPGCHSLFELCTKPDGEPGVRCGPGAPCYNPCLKGMAPESATYCAKRCKKDAECGAGGTCTERGVCDTWPKFDCKDEDIEPCELPVSGMGSRCKGTKKCLSNCKRGLVLMGGTHCAKPCTSNAQCPSGECEGKTFCGPLCPAEGCPYRWE